MSEIRQVSERELARAQACYEQAMVYRNPSSTVTGICYHGRAIMECESYNCQVDSGRIRSTCGKHRPRTISAPEIVEL